MEALDGPGTSPFRLILTLVAVVLMLVSREPSPRNEPTYRLLTFSKGTSAGSIESVPEFVLGPPNKPVPDPTDATPPPELRSGAQVNTPLLILRTCPSGPGPGLRASAVTAPSITFAAAIA